MNKEKIRKEEEVCPFRQAMDLLSGKWRLSIVNNLMAGTRRFHELEKEITGINTRMLVKELKVLEANGLVERKAFATVPPTVEYSLTEKGLSMKPVIQEIQKWAVSGQAEA